MTLRRLPALRLLTIAATAMLIAWPAAAQSDRALRQENQQLKTRLADLQAEYDAAQQRIKDLESRIRQLELAVHNAGGTPATTPPPPKVTVDETKADASPRGLFHALEQSYLQAVGETDRGEFGDRVRTGYLRAVDRWIKGANRTFRKPIEWRVRLLEGRQVHGRIEARLQAVDPVTDAELGEPFWVVLRERVATYLQRMEQRHGELGVLKLDGVLVPTLALDPTLEVEDEAFSNARLVGPFATFSFDVDVRSLSLPEREEEEADGEETTSTDATDQDRRDR